MIRSVRVWLHYSLSYAASPEHRRLQDIAVAQLPESLRGELRAMHGYFMTTIAAPLAALGIPEPVSHSHLVFAAVGDAAARIDAGADFVTEAAALERFVGAGLQAAMIDGAAES